MHNVFVFIFYLLTLQFIDEDDEDGDKDMPNFFDDVSEKTEEMEPNDSTSQDGNPAASLCLSPVLLLRRSCRKTTLFFTRR